jgi:hypothetical protein
MPFDIPDNCISGIHNYCDRWCEKCRFNDRCAVYYQEQKVKARHELLGEDPDDPAVFLQDLEETFGQTIEMLREMAEEMGVDLEQAQEEDEEEEPIGVAPRRRRDLDYHRNNPLYARVEAWADRFEPILNTVRAGLPEVALGQARQVVADDLDEERIKEAITKLGDAIELIGQYRFLIPVKTARALSSLEDARMAEDDPEMREIHMSQAEGTGKLVYECVEKVVAALWQIGEFHRDWLDMSLPVAGEGQAILQAIDEAIPGHRDFRRPGFDDPEYA